MWKGLPYFLKPYSVTFLVHKYAEIHSYKYLCILRWGHAVTLSWCIHLHLRIYLF